LAKQEPIYEHTEIGFEGSPEELALFILVAGCQCIGDDEELPMLNEKVTKIGISFRAHPKFKSTLQILYISSPWQTWQNNPNNSMHQSN
jgi:hypothetical protein